MKTKWMRRTWSAVLAVVMLLSVLPMGVFAVDVAYSYHCATLYSDGTLEITADVSNLADIPWQNERTLIKKVVFKVDTQLYTRLFSDCTNLAEITLPSTVTKIPSFCFNSCPSLTSITIPDSVTSIGERAFSGCSVLGSVIFGENSNLQSIGNHAFNQCDALTSITIPDSVTSIGIWVFNSCDTLASIVIPDYVTSIGERAFSDCKKLSSITFGVNSQLQTIGIYAFNNCDVLTSIAIPDTVTSIGEKAFNSCDVLTDIYYEGNIESWNSITKGDGAIPNVVKINHTGSCVDADTNHICDLCGKNVGSHTDTDKDHICDYGCTVAIGTCEDSDKDHACDYGCDKIYGTHADTDKDHACDYGCSVTIGTCEDADKDHACDYGCDKIYGAHIDTDKDHDCDYGCSVTIGTCEDTDKDHNCDNGCGKTYGTHEDTDKDHDCDYGCSVAIGEHTDSDKNHICDHGCAETIGAHADSANDNDHLCDYGCGETLEEHSDTNKDYLCDICQTSLDRPDDPITTPTDTHGGEVIVPQTAKPGDEVTIRVIPDSGKEIGAVTVTDQSGIEIAVRDNSDGTYTFIQPEGGVHISVTFKDSVNADMWYWMLLMLYNQQFDVTATATNGGTITPEGVSKVKYDKNATYTITPAEGYMIADVLVDGESIGAVSEYTFKRVKKDHSITAIFAEIPWQNPYSDVSESDWFHEDVKFVTENNLMIGTVDNETFAPDLTATRAMIVTILWRLEEEPVVNYLMQFEDVPQDEWYSEAVRWAAANGIVLGYDGLFNPENPITREQLAAILHRYAAYKGVDNGVIFPMIPRYDYSEWAENDVIWADMNGLLDGVGNDMTYMTAESSRAEVAAMLRRFCERFTAK